MVRSRIQWWCSAGWGYSIQMLGGWSWVVTLYSMKGLRVASYREPSCGMGGMIECLSYKHSEKSPEGSPSLICLLEWIRCNAPMRPAMVFLCWRRAWWNFFCYTGWFPEDCSNLIDLREGSSLITGSIVITLKRLFEVLTGVNLDSATIRYTYVSHVAYVLTFWLWSWWK